MSYEGIIAEFGVPARPGAPVKAFGYHPGKVIGEHDGLVLVRLDDNPVAHPFHPLSLTWDEENGPATRVPQLDLAPTPNWPAAATFAELTQPQWSGV